MADVKQKVALSSIGASAGLTAAKAVVGVMSGSLVLLSERSVPSRGARSVARDQKAVWR
jgi:hypothetical protein